jgi:hypothetical protein
MPIFGNHWIVFLAEGFSTASTRVGAATLSAPRIIRRFFAPHLHWRDHHWFAFTEPLSNVPSMLGALPQSQNPSGTPM